MIDVSRRRFLSLAASVSAAGALLPWASAAPFVGPPAKRSATGNELCLIFAGSWLFVFEDGPYGKHIRAITPSFDEHAYHYGESTAQTLGRADLQQGVSYNVTVKNGGHSSSSPKSLVQPLIASGSGFVYTSSVKLRKDLDPSKIRSVIIPLPDFIDAAGTVTTTTTIFDPSAIMPGTAMGAHGLARMPAAYVLRYVSATGAVVHGGSGPISIGAHKHLQFRTVPMMYDIDNLPCALCETDKAAGAEHASMAFDQMMELLSFPAGMTKPAIKIPASCHGEKSPSVPGVDPKEYGFIPECKSEASDPTQPLHGVGMGACGNLGGVVGGGDG